MGTEPETQAATKVAAVQALVVAMEGMWEDEAGAPGMVETRVATEAAMEMAAARP